MSSAVRKFSSVLEDRVDWKKVALIGAGVVATGVVAYGTYSYLYASNDQSAARASSSNASSKTAAPVARVPPTKKETTAATKQEKTVQVPQHQSDALRIKGNELFKAHQYAEAIEAYTRAIECCPPDVANESKAVYYQNRAAAYERMENYEKAVEDCTSATLLHPKYAKAFLRRSKLNEKLGNLTQAVDDITLTCILERFQNYTTLQEADTVLRGAAADEARKYMAARAAGGDMAPTVSVSFIDAYLSSFMCDPLIERAKLLQNKSSQELTGVDVPLYRISRKQYDKVADAAQKVLDDEHTSQNDRLAALALHGTFCLLTGRTEMARTSFESFRALFNELPEQDRKADSNQKLAVNMHIKHASLCMQMADRERADAELAAAVALDASNPDAYHHRAQLRMINGDMQLALEDYDVCCRLAPEFDVAHVQAAYCRYRVASSGESTRELNDAILALEKCVNQFDKCADGYALLGQVYAERDDMAGADEMYKKALLLQPNNANILVHMGLLELGKGNDISRAKEFMMKATEVDPHSQFAWETIGTIEVQRGDMAIALEYFDRALHLGRSEPEVMHTMGLKIAAQAQLRGMRTLGIPGDLPIGNPFQYIQ